MTQAGSGGTFTGIAMQMLREGSTFFLGVAKLRLVVALSPPYWEDLSATGEKEANMQKGRDKQRQETYRGRVMVVQNLVLSSRSPGPGAYSSSSASVDYVITHRTIGATNSLTNSLNKLGFCYLQKKKIRTITKNFFATRKIPTITLESKVH